jgi:hypothetical protein
MPPINKKKKKTQKRRSKYTLQYGTGNGAMTYYTGPPMHGYGLAGILARLARGVIPLFKRPIVQAGIKRIGKSMATAGLDAIQQSMSAPSDAPVSFGRALKGNVKKQAKLLTSEASKSMLKRVAQPPPVPAAKTIKRRARPARFAVVPQRSYRRDIFST